MRQLDSDLWVVDSPLSVCGVEIGARMTILRLPGDSLIVHSPVRLTEQLLRQVRALGEISTLIAPNRFHHLFLPEWQRTFPEAQVHVAPGVEEKRPELRITGTFGKDPEPRWASAIDHQLLEGAPSMNEVVFFHRPSATLVVSDLAFNFGPSSPTLTRWAFRAAGSYGGVRPTHLERVLVRERAAFRRSLGRVLEWPFERIIVAHGEISEKKGRAELVDGYAWLFQGEESRKFGFLGN